MYIKGWSMKEFHPKYNVTKMQGITRNEREFNEDKGQ